MEENTNITNAAENVAENQTADNQAGNNTPEQAEKTFTQKELDEIVKNRLDRAKKDMPSKDELKAFREWQDSQKTAEQKAADDLAAANSAREAAEKEANSLKIRLICLSKGVIPERADAVIAIAEKQVNDDTPIESAVNSVIEQYPEFCGKQQSQSAPGITTGVKSQIPPVSSAGKNDFLSIIKENQVKRK